jgi:iron complex transport system substrate-binding protein
LSLYFSFNCSGIGSALRRHQEQSLSKCNQIKEAVEISAHFGFQVFLRRLLILSFSFNRMTFWTVVMLQVYNRSVHLKRLLISMKLKRFLLFAVFSATLISTLSCQRFSNQAADVKDERYVVISQVYNEIIWALAAQDHVVGVDYSSTYPPEVKKVQTVGYHRALSAEGILSLHPTAIIHDGNIGPPQVLEQFQSLNIPMKTFNAKNNSIDGTKALMREMGDYFHKEQRAEELCRALDSQMAASLESVKKYSDHPRIAIIHFGRASNVYLVVGRGGSGDGGAASQMIEWAGGQMAIDSQGMQRMTSPEILAQANPDIILVTDFGYDRLGDPLPEIKALPGVATSNAAKNNQIYRIEENLLMYFGPRSGENVEKVAAIIHQK